MKKLLTALSAVLMGASLCYGSGLGVFVSQWDPDTKGLDSTTGYGAKLTFGDGLGFELRGAYYDDDILQLIPADAGLVFNLPLGNSGAFSLYAEGGATWYFMDSDAGQVDDQAGWYAGGGLELTLTDGIALFADAQYRSLDYTAPNDNTGDLEKKDESIKAMTYNGGLVFKF